MFKNLGNTRSSKATTFSPRSRWASLDLGRSANQKITSGSKRTDTKLWRLWLWVAIVFVGACLVFAPASWLAAGLANASQGKIRLVSAQGSVWSGSAALVLAGGSASLAKTVPSATPTSASLSTSTSASPATQLESRLSWKLRPQLRTSSGWLGLSAELQAACCITGLLRIEATAWNTQTTQLPLQISNSTLSVPLSLLKGLGAPWNTLGLDGQLTVRTENLGLGNFQGANTRSENKPSTKLVQGQLSFDVRTVSSALTPVAPLGHYTGNISASADGQALNLQLKDQPTDAASASPENPLSLVANGDVQLRQRRISFSGTASARPDMETSLGNLLGLVGQRQGRVAQIALQSRF